MKKQIISLCLMVSMTLFLAACGGKESNNESSQGEVIIGLTDADGDFLTYAVAVKSLSLTQDNGQVVQTLPLADGAMVDFTQYTELTEFFTAASIPNGKYVKATMVLDYAEADVQVEVNGEPVAATVEDAQGNPLNELEVSVSLTNHGALRVVPGVPAHLTLDFDLEASNSVDLVDPQNPVVTVEPVLLADLMLEDPKEHRMRGLLRNVNEDEGFLQLTLRPFFKYTGSYGSFKAHVNDDTAYEVNGVTYTGSEGLSEMALLGQGTWVIVLGMLDVETRHFEAHEVYAGDSVPGSEFDMVRGAVTARSGDVLVVNAGTVVKTDGSLLFNVDVTVTLDDDTPVTRQLSNDNVTKDDISVGQRIVFAGDLQGGSLDGYTLRSPERVRMLISQAAGHVVNTDAVNSELVLDVASMNARLVEAYDFSGTGVDAANDADAEHYQVNTSTLSLEGYSQREPLRVRGFVNAFGQAPADFDAQTLISVVDTRARMMMNWTPASDAAFVSLTTDAIVVSLHNISGPLHHVRRKGVYTDLVDLSKHPVLVPAEIGAHVFTLHQGGAVEVFTDFESFTLALSERLELGSLLRHISADGYFSDDSSTLQAHRVSVVLNPALPK